MYTITIKENETGYERTLTNVMSYDAITIDDVDIIIEDHKLKKMTPAQIARLSFILDKMESIPNMSELRQIIEEFQRS